MEPIAFKLVDHSLRSGVKIVEIYRGNILMGIIYPHKEGIHIVSKHLGINPEDKVKTVREGNIQIPTLLVSLP